jgi:iodotyrosine deiodinase
MKDRPFLPLSFRTLPEPEMLARAEDYRAELERRRSVRAFSDRAVPRRLIELAIETASSAPSGAHQQPWRFVAVSDPQCKAAIRAAAEHEERMFYEGGRMPEAWRAALEPIGTDWHKPYLETVPWIVVLFEELYGHEADGSRRAHYYTKESVGIAAGFFITALHRMGLATLTHTPSPMGFLSRLLGRPQNERPFILFPIGYPANDAEVPALRRKSLEEVAIFDPPMQRPPSETPPG